MTNLAQTQNYPFCNVTLVAPISNVTGDGTTYTVALDTVAAGNGYNVSNGIFTAPAALYYLFTYVFELTGLTTSHTSGTIKFVSTFGTFQTENRNAQASKNASNSTIISGVCPVKMAVNDTAFITLQVSNGTKVVGLGTASIINIAGFL